MNAVMTTSESQRLETLEETIDRGMRTFVDVGNALLEIRDNRLYRVQFGTFEDYCRERWGMVSRQANRLIAAAEVTTNLRPIGPIPSTESQARPLTILEPEQQQEVWQRAVETAPAGKVTAAHVQNVVSEYRNPEPEPVQSFAITIEEDEDPEPARHVTVADEYGAQETYRLGESEELTIARSEPTPAPSKMAIHYSSETPEHYTPAVIIEAAINVMGDIDLDPCSNSIVNPNVPATTHYTIDNDGLCQSWHGRVYMNPPYGREIGAWVRKLVSEYEKGNVSEAIALVPGRIDTEWYRQLTIATRLVCHVTGRLTFIGNDDPAPFPSVVAYLGDNDATFYEVFSEHGEMWQRISSDMMGV